MFFRDSFVDDKITELKRNVANLQAWCTSNANITEAQYRVRRCREVNKVAIEALTGLEVREKNDDLKVGKTHTAPTMAQVIEISTTIQDLVNGIEKLVREAIDRSNPRNLDDDTGVPAEYRISTHSFQVNLGAKPKELKNQLLGDNSISREYFDGMDCMKISQIGEKIRKDGKFKRNLIIGGIVLGVVIIGAAAFFMVKRYQKRKAEEIEGNEDLQRIADRQFETMDSDPDIISAVDTTSDVAFGDVPQVKI